jgi:hypothetical protein
MMDWFQFQELFIENLSDDLLDSKRRQYKKMHPLLDTTYGHCYVVSEAAYYLLGGKDAGWTPHCMKVNSTNHWFLKHSSDFILDITKHQFISKLDYSKAKGKGFLTKEPSKRTRILLKKISESETWLKLKNKTP